MVDMPLMRAIFRLLQPELLMVKKKLRIQDVLHWMFVWDGEWYLHDGKGWEWQLSHIAVWA